MLIKNSSLSPVLLRFEPPHRANSCDIPAALDSAFGYTLALPARVLIAVRSTSNSSRTRRTMNLFSQPPFRVVAAPRRFLQALCVLGIRLNATESMLHSSAHEVLSLSL